MLGVIYHWDNKRDIGVAAKRLVYQGYDYTCRAYNVDRVVVVDLDGDFGSINAQGVLCVNSINSALQEFAGYTPILVSCDNEAMSLNDFIHPSKGVYIVGGDFSELNLTDEIDCIRIDYTCQNMELWSDVALGIVLYDRSTKVNCGC